MIPFLINGEYDALSFNTSAGEPVVDGSGNSFSVRDATADFPSNNDLGPLPDCIECLTESELNGGYELSLRYPTSGIGFENIAIGNIVLATNENGGERQPYRIYRITKPINGIVSVFARHIVQADLAGIPVKPYSADNVVSAIGGINENAMFATGFTFSTNKQTVANFSVQSPASILSIMGGSEGSLLDVYGGEFKYDGKSVSLLDSIGEDNGVKIKYGLNMTDFEQDANFQNCYTGAVGYWESESETVHTGVVPASGAFGHVKIATVDLTEKFETAPTVAELTAETERYITANKIGVPDVSIKLSFVDLSKTEEYAGLSKSVRLGDTVHIDFSKIGVTASARVAKIKWNVLAEKYESIDIGSVKETVADTIAKQSKKIEESTTRKMVGVLASKELFVNGEKVRWQ